VHFHQMKKLGYYKLCINKMPKKQKRAAI